MKKKIAVWTGLLCVLFSFRVFAGDVIVVVDRFTDIGNKAHVRFSICDSEACHRRKDKGYVEIEAQLIEENEGIRKYKIKNVASGEYSLSAYHDLNNSGELERSGIQNGMRLNLPSAKKKHKSSYISYYRFGL